MYRRGDLGSLIDIPVGAVQTNITPEAMAAGASAAVAELVKSPVVIVLVGLLVFSLLRK